MWWFGYPGGFRGWLNDWRLGWNVNDLKSGLAKVEAGRNLPPGSIVWVTHREMKALTDAREAYPEWAGKRRND